MDEVVYASAVSLARAIRTREVSAAEVVAAHLERIAAVNPRLNAIVQLMGDTARTQAQTADAARCPCPSWKAWPWTTRSAG